MRGRAPVDEERREGAIGIAARRHQQMPAQHFARGRPAAERFHDSRNARTPVGLDNGGKSVEAAQRDDAMQSRRLDRLDGFPQVAARIGGRIGRDQLKIGVGRGGNELVVRTQIGVRAALGDRHTGNGGEVRGQAAEVVGRDHEVVDVVHGVPQWSFGRLYHSSAKLEKRGEKTLFLLQVRHTLSTGGVVDYANGK